VLQVWHSCSFSLIAAPPVSSHLFYLNTSLKSTHVYTSLTIYFEQTFMNKRWLFISSNKKLLLYYSVFQMHVILHHYRVSCGVDIFWSKWLRLIEYDCECTKDFPCVVVIPMQKYCKEIEVRCTTLWLSHVFLISSSLETIYWYLRGSGEWLSMPCAGLCVCCLEI
jgi:hypothetical protein